MSLFVIFVPCFRVQVVTLSRIKIILFRRHVNHGMSYHNPTFHKVRNSQKKIPKSSTAQRTLDPLVTNNDDRQNKSLITFSIKRCNPVVDSVPVPVLLTMAGVAQPSPFMWVNIYEVLFEVGKGFAI